MSMSPLGYCLECFAKHLGRANEYLGEGVDFYQRDNAMTARVQQKMRAAEDTLGAMDDDLTPMAPPTVRRIHDQAQMIRKRIYATGLDMGAGNVNDILERKEEVRHLQNTLFSAKKQLSTDLGWIGKELNLQNPVRSPPNRSKSSQRLKDRKTNNKDSETKLVTYTEVAGINGGEFLAKGLERAFVEVDKMTNRAAMAVHLRPSTWMNIGLGIAEQVVPLWLRWGAPWDLTFVSMGSHHLTKTIDYIEELAAPPVAARVVYTAGGRQVTYTRNAQGVNNGRVMTRPPGAQATIPASYDVTPYRGP